MNNHLQSCNAIQSLPVQKLMCRLLQEDKEWLHPCQLHIQRLPIRMTRAIVQPENSAMSCSGQQHVWQELGNSSAK